MGESAAGRTQVTSDSHSPASFSKAAEANGNCKNAKGSLSSKCSNTTSKMRSGEDRSKCWQCGAAYVELCPKGHICHKCCSGLFGHSSLFYGAPDYVLETESYRSITRARSNYNTESLIDESGTDLEGNWWQGSYHY